VKIRLKYYLQYMHTQTDDSPLYLFDSTFGEKTDMKDIKDGYEVPEYFDADLFNLVCVYVCIYIYIYMCVCVCVVW
jgi:hypothetical protein